MTLLCLVFFCTLALAGNAQPTAKVRGGRAFHCKYLFTQGFLIARVQGAARSRERSPLRRVPRCALPRLLGLRWRFTTPVLLGFILGVAVTILGVYEYDSTTGRAGNGLSATAAGGKAPMVNWAVVNDGQLGRGQRWLAQFPDRGAVDHRQHRTQAKAAFRLIRCAAGLASTARHGSSHPPGEGSAAFVRPSAHDALGGLVTARQLQPALLKAEKILADILTRCIP